MARHLSNRHFGEFANGKLFKADAGAIAAKWCFVRIAVIDHTKMLHSAANVRFGELHCGTAIVGQCLFWAVLDERPRTSNFDGFGDCQGIFQLNAEITHRTVHFGVTQ